MVPLENPIDEMILKTKEEIKELVECARRYLPPFLRPPPPAKKPLSDSVIKERRDRLNAMIEGVRFLMKAEEDRANKTLGTKAGADSDYTVKINVDEKDSDVDERQANIKTTRHESDEEEKERPQKRACV